MHSIYIRIYIRYQFERFVRYNSDNNKNELIDRKL